MSPVIPVLTLEDPAVAVGVAHALAAGGLTTIELTLRTPHALDCIRAIADSVPEVAVGAGTILSPAQMDQARTAGAQFLVSPGASDRLIDAARSGGHVWLPGIGTVSEAMRLAEAGFPHQKFFPAEASGGTTFIKSLAPVLPDLRFCPTGGISAARAAEYLGLTNVFAVGGTWVTPAAAIAAGEYGTVTRLAQEACHILGFNSQGA
jgi:2-dehydro-3-deoxyphosphogluconate aldolase/(4S)-4-hydroxy-2-oxoglutarate aldolase